VKPVSSKLLKLLAKREYPTLFALASKWITTPLLFICTLVYIQGSFTQPAAKVLPIGLSALGMTAGLSGICFSMVKAYGNHATPKYAGEKFLHSSVLLIQSLVLLYLRDTIIKSDWTKSWPSLVLPVNIFVGTVLPLVTFASA